MKNETARREIESLDYYLQNHTDDYSEESHTAMMMAVDALSSSEKPTEWIPISERLPEINEWVVCQCRANIYEVLKFTSYGWYHDDAHCYMDGFVIAWMPLPKPYKAESEDKE